MKKILVFMLFTMILLAGCGSNANAPDGDLPPMITLYGSDYIAPYMPVNELPDGYSSSLRK